MRVSIDSATCQGHGRCYDLAPDLFGEDEEGYATLTALTADGEVPAGREGDVRLAAANCPESAVLVHEEARL
ncbi:ferredoxin [Blastococcus sp. TML/M2B]|uniref:ferredoxin n=1 Tax=unclassified Blastococcus TaxID=2619396 RepID=UPI00190C31A8|nr:MULTISPECIES: ferredoxin [unclassified Blastococcus]MBN1091992.1 ferredoxin [Blastococcus sp. TML/M2B]MBN1097905.1 ferredoxin [Blastococcus sp. TML/C7B]